jgi:hypothetical protein
MKNIILLGALIVCASATQAQLLKKLKDKVNKTINKDDSKTASSTVDASSSNSNKDHWCDTITADAVGGDGVSYSKAYSGGSDNMNIVYSECSMGLQNNPLGYRLILSQYANGKTQYVVVENGKVVDSDTKVKDQYLGRGMRSETADNSQDNDEMKKYIVADSVRHTIPKTQGKSVTVQKVDDDQVEMALNIVRQSDEYKDKSDAEKKEMEEAMRKGFAMNNGMAGKTITAPATQGANFTTVSGYNVMVKGKNYGKFIMPPTVVVSQDESSIFVVGVDDKSTPLMVTQTKKMPLDKNRFLGNSGRMFKSADYKKAVYIELKQMTENELQQMASGANGSKMIYNALRNDGTVLQLVDYNGLGKFKVTNAGAIININEATGEVYSDNKKLGQFSLGAGEQVETDAVMIGSGPSNIAYFSGSNGSLNYLDGSVKKLGILNPRVTSQNGKTYINWFRKCGGDIYLGKFSY